jgi:hypothetical protein
MSSIYRGMILLTIPKTAIRQRITKASRGANIIVVFADPIEKMVFRAQMKPVVL